MTDRGWIRDEVAGIGEPVLDSDGNRIGILTADGPVYCADPETLEDVREAGRKSGQAVAEEISARARRVMGRDMSRLLDAAKVDPAKAVTAVDQLTAEERKAVLYALQHSDSVSLPVASRDLHKTREYRDGTYHRTEVAMGRAFFRLYNRGLATVDKRDDGLVWLTVSRERLLSVIRSEVAAKRRGGPDDIYLMKVPCEIQTLPSGQTPRKTRPDHLTIPKNASGERLCACRLLTGVKMLSEDDHNEIDWRFLRYMDETEQKIIALLDPASGETIGAEYSTRFNDIAKAAANLRKFDYALDKSFEENSRAVFLTLTTDPNLTDAERAEIKAAKIRKLESQLSSPALSGKRRDAVIRQYWQAVGPDAEISELERRKKAGTATPADVSRLRSLEADREHAKRLRLLLEDPRVGVRTKESAVHGLKKMNRWEYRWDPNGFKSNWEANRSFAPAWNRFMSYVKKIVGRRPQYVSAYEFTESGLLHIHVLMFVKYLADIDRIAMEWRRVGQGEVSYIYSLRAARIRGQPGKYKWVWNSSRCPSDARGSERSDGGQYLKKYVRKAMLAMMDDFTSPASIQSLYWAFNKRFNTCSRALMDGFREEEETEVPAAPSRWTLWRIMTREEASAELREDQIIYRRVTRESMAERRRLRAEEGGAEV